VVPPCFYQYRQIQVRQDKRDLEKWRHRVQCEGVQDSDDELWGTGSTLETPQLKKCRPRPGPNWLLG